MKLTDTILEKGLFTLKKFAGFIPAPALGTAIEAVCACIDHYHVRSSNLFLLYQAHLRDCARCLFAPDSVAKCFPQAGQICGLSDEEDWI